MDERMVTSGFLIVKTSTRMYREYLKDIETPMQYRGIDREPIQAWMEALRGSGVVEPTDQELAASLFLTELEDAGKAYDTFVFAL